MQGQINLIQDNLATALDVNLIVKGDFTILETSISAKSGSIIATINNAYSTSEDQDFFRHLIKNSPLAMFIIFQGKISYANKLAELLFGYSQGELISSVIEILVPDHLQAIYTNHRKQFAEQPYLHMMGLNLELSGQKKLRNKIDSYLGYLKIVQVLYEN